MSLEICKKRQTDFSSKLSCLTSRFHPRNASPSARPRWAFYHPAGQHDHKPLAENGEVYSHYPPQTVGSCSKREQALDASTKRFICLLYIDMMLHPAYTVYTHIVYIESPPHKSTNYWFVGGGKLGHTRGLEPHWMMFPLGW